MQLKRYFAPNMRQAMLLVKKELGDSAVIMSNKQTDEGVEIVAAIDPDASPEPTSRRSWDAAPARSSYISPEKVIEPVAQFQQTHEMTRMSEELKAVRSLLENQLSGLAWGHSEHAEPNKIALIKRLVGLGVGWNLAQDLVSSVDANSDMAWPDILKKIEDSIPLDEQDIVDRGGIVALIGPTGVGKTTTIAKMASRFVMRNSPSQLALVTTDCYKIGAQAQLKTFADLLGVPVHVVKTEGELYSLLGSLSAKKLVLVDTAGMSQKDLQLSQQLTQEQTGFRAIRNYLVISAATQLKVLQQVVNSFGRVGIRGCILTKVDEALQLGNIITLLVENKLSLAYLSSGQRVPEDLEPVRVREFIDKTIVLGQQNLQSDSDETAFRMGMGKEISDAQ